MPTFHKTDTAGRPIYRDQNGWAWTFYRIGEHVASFYFPVFADNNPIQMMAGFYEGMQEAQKKLNLKTIFWLTPEEYIEKGGTFKL